MKHFFAAIILFFFSVPLYASHIVGGELYYECLGNNQYRITLKLYRDCYCVNCAPFGDPEYLTIFDANGGMYSQPAMFFPGSTQLNPTINNPCMTQPPDICVERAIYTTVVTLPPGSGGYDIVYQRCCRNDGISNIPIETGATYQVHVPDPSLASCNSSPRYSNFPPMYICANAPLIFDHSATDPDGDQLVYSLCDPFSGADVNCPAPNPDAQLGCPTFPNPPPYSSVPFISPYNTNNFLNNPPTSGNLRIDPQTGVITGTPNTSGMFVVAVCVSEYRNGVLLSEMRRDFQFNVTQCNVPLANIPSSNINPVTGIGLYVLQCSSSTVTFQNNSYNPPPASVPLQYEWDFGVPGVTTDTSSLQFPTYTYADTGTYLVKLIATKSNGAQPCSDTTYAYVKIYPTFRSDFVTANTCQDSAARFLDQTLSTEGPITQWNWSFGDGSTSTQANPSHLYSAPGTYTATLINQNALGCRDTAQRSITIYQTPTANFTYGPTCVNSPVTFTNSSTGSVSSLNWTLGNGATSTQQNPVNTYTTAGNYTVRLFLISPEGCKDTATQNITVHPLPVINISNDTTICPFTSVQLSASGGITYSWTPSAGLNNAAISNPTATPTPPSPVTYVVNVTDQFQCSNADSVRISFNPIPQIDAGPDTSVCLNPGSFRDSVRLQASGGVSYQWSPSTGLSATNVSNPVSRPPFSITYYVLGTDANGCMLTDSVAVYFLDPSLNLIVDDSKTICERDTAFVNAINQGASGYSWNPTLFATNPNSYQSGFYPADTTNYILTITNYCYTKSDTILIAVNPIPQLGLNPFDSICLFDSIPLQASGALTYQWNPDATLSATNIPNPTATPTVTTKYYVTGTSADGCVNIDSTLILVYYPSNILVFPDDTPFICFGSSVQLWVTGAYTYSWNPDPSLSATSIANPIATPSDTTEYFVEATNVHGCKSYDSVTINVQHPVTAVTESPFDACEGVPVQLQASGGFYYEWSPPTGLNNPFTSHPFANPGISTFYIVKVSNDCFSDTAIAEVIVHPLPIVDAGNDTLIWRDTYAQLNGFTNETNHFWNPSTWLDDPFDLSTKAQPQQTQWYELFAIDEYGCMNKDSVLITVEPYTVLEIPTAFSPDGNGVNDVFRIVRWLNIYDLKEFSVYNRWGQKVFQTNNIEQGWDGTYKESKCDLGVYVWMVIVVTKEQEEVVRKGNVTLLR